ncbi:hypothetical protein G5I_01290 [Acromyrmex echinatior]|uniref:Uncharacterized protein n=1 Tax=Acromyrmex echinatior TaxID=103372 RepID=F4W781_ACREC|nr:hypothetical protein G5I_01290 [Acromyrmex echinatior]
MDLESPSKKLYERSRPPAALSSETSSPTTGFPVPLHLLSDVVSRQEIVKKEEGSKRGEGIRDAEGKMVKKEQEKKEGKEMSGSRRKMRKKKKKKKTVRKKRRKTMEKRAKRETLAAVSTRYTYTSNLAWPGIEAAADFREVPRSQAAARCNQHVTSWIWKVITRLSHGPVSGSDLSIVSIPLRHRRALPRRRSVPGVPLSTGEQSSVGARTKRMTLVRIARISVVLVVSLLLLLLLIVDGSWAQAYPREIKPGERYGDGNMVLTH